MQKVQTIICVIFDRATALEHAKMQSHVLHCVRGLSISLCATAHCLAATVRSATYIAALPHGCVPLCLAFTQSSNLHSAYAHLHLHSNLYTLQSPVSDSPTIADPPNLVSKSRGEQVALYTVTPFLITFLT